MILRFKKLRCFSTYTQNPKFKKLSYSSFKKFFMYPKKSKSFFRSFRKVLLKNKGSFTKTQLDLEKLSNIISIKRKDKLMTFNPLWYSIILKEYSTVLSSLKEGWNSIFELSSIHFKRLNINNFYFNLIFTPKEVLSVFLYSFFSSSVKESELNYVLSVTFRSKFAKNLTLFFEVFFKERFFYMFLKESIKKDEISLFLKKKFKNITYNCLFSLDNFDEYLKAMLKDKNKLYSFSVLSFISFSFKKILKFNPINLNSLYFVANKVKGFFDDYFYSSENKSILFFSMSEFSQTILSDFSANGKIILFQKKVKNKKNYKYLSISDPIRFSSLSSLFFFLSNLPMLVPPRDWDSRGTMGGYLLNKNQNNSCLPLTKPLTKGLSSIVYSKAFLRAINIVQSLPYHINTLFFNFLKTPYFRKDHSIFYDKDLYNFYITYFDVESEFFDLKEKYSSQFYEYFLKKKILFTTGFSLLSDNLSKLPSEDKKKLSSEDKKKLLENLALEVGLPENYNYLRDLLKKRKTRFFSYLQSRLEYDFYLNIINSLNDCISNTFFYNVSRCDFRGRFGPSGWILHRATGKYKHLLSTYDLHIIDSFSVKYLKVAIASLFTKKDTFDDYLDWFAKNIGFFFSPLTLDNLRDCITLIDFFCNTSENNLDKDFFINLAYKKYPSQGLSLNIKDFYLFLYNFLSKSSDSGYFLIILYDYIKYLSCLKTGSVYFSNLTLSFDQTSSGACFLSMLTFDKDMATILGLISCKKKNDLYSNFLVKFKKDLFSTKSFTKYDIEDFTFFRENFDILFTRNEFSKLLIMPTFYYMKKPGIISLLNDRIDICFDSTTDSLPSLSLRSKFSDYLFRLLRFFYPKTIAYMDLLVDCCGILQKQRVPIKFKTFDGSLIKYSYIKENVMVKKAPVSLLPNSKKKYISYRVFLPIDESLNEFLPDHSSTFPPNFIHSLDAGICRLLISIFYDIFKIILRPLHDSFNIPPLYISSFYSLVRYLFIYLFFNPLVSLCSITLYVGERFANNDKRTGKTVKVLFFSFLDINSSKNSVFYSEPLDSFHSYKIIDVCSLYSLYKVNPDNFLFFYFFNNLSLDIDTEKELFEFYKRGVLNLGIDYSEKNLLVFLNVLRSDFIYFF